VPCEWRPYGLAGAARSAEDHQRLQDLTGICDVR
jgi:hypothetical protein